MVDSSTPVRAPRLLPHNLSAEAAILGGAILWNEVLEDLADVETDDFYDFRHKVVWQAIRNLDAANKPIDVVTLENEIERQGKLDAIGGIAFLGELTLRVPTRDNVRAYRDNVRLLARNGRAIQELNALAETAWTWPHEPSELIPEITARLQRIEQSKAPPAPTFHLISIDEAYDELSRLATAPIYPTPFRALNDAIGFGGLLGTQVYTVAAGTGRGKTSFVAELASFAVTTVPVLVSVHELGPGYFVARRSAGQLGMHSNDIIRGKASRAEIHRAMPFGDRMMFLHRPTLQGLRDATDHIAQKFGVAPLLIVDYLQKLADEIAAGQKHPDLRMATSAASATLLEIGEKTGAAVVSVSSIGRGKRALDNPRKLHPYQLVEVAKESGAVEYDGAAMIVLSLSNDYDGDEGERIATMTLAKARFGRECHIDARYHGARGSWRDIGEVEVTEKSATDKPSVKPKAEVEEREDHVRRAILRELEKAPARNKTALCDRVRGCRKDIVRAQFARMIDEGIVVAIGGYFGASPTGRQLLLEVPS